MELIDSHVHFWNPNHLTYGWVEGNPTLSRAWLPADYAAATSEHTVAGMVFVEAGCSSEENLREVEWAAALDAPIKGIVAHAVLENEDGREATLEALAAHPLVKGVRRNYQDEAPGWARQGAFVAGVKALPQHGLSFDICIKHHQLDETIALVKACPDVQFILDHIAKPNIAGGEHSSWAAGMKKLAELDNIVCKISGVVTEADHKDWRPQGIQPYISTAIEAFGIERVMFGSDWPVVNLAASFGAWAAALELATAGWGAGDMDKLLVDNAVRFYRL